MRSRFILPVLIGAALCVPALPAAEMPVTVCAAESGQVYGLILKCSLGLSRDESGQLVITAKTQATGLMSEVGFSEITLQRSSDCENWTDEKKFGGSFGKNVRYYIIDGLTAPAEEGYYYRAVCTHYATSNVTGVQTQTAENSSRPMWISKSSVPSAETLPADEPKKADETVTTAAGTAPAEVQQTSAKNSTTAANVTTQKAAAAKTGSPATGDALPAAETAVLAVSAAAVFTLRKKKK